MKVMLIQAESPLDAFCREVPDGDRCSRRRDYDEHEYRQGFRRAEIHLNVEEKQYFDGLYYMEPDCEEVARQTSQG